MNVSGKAVAIVTVIVGWLVILTVAVAVLFVRSYEAHSAMRELARMSVEMETRDNIRQEFPDLEKQQAESKALLESLSQ